MDPEDLLAAYLQAVVFDFLAFCLLLIKLRTNHLLVCTKHFFLARYIPFGTKSSSPTSKRYCVKH